MIPSEYKDLIDKLHQKTSNQNITWEPGAQENQYVTSFEKHSIVIEKKRVLKGFDSGEKLDSGGHLDAFINKIVVSLRDSEGNVIDKFDCREGTSGWSPLYKLYTSARRNFYNVTEAIEAIKEQLDSI